MKLIVLIYSITSTFILYSMEFKVSTLQQLSEKIIIRAVEEKDVTAEITIKDIQKLPEHLKQRILKKLSRIPLGYIPCEPEFNSQKKKHRCYVYAGYVIKNYRNPKIKKRDQERARQRKEKQYARGQIYDVSLLELCV